MNEKEEKWFVVIVPAVETPWVEIFRSAEEEEAERIRESCAYKGALLVVEKPELRLSDDFTWMESAYRERITCGLTHLKDLCERIEHAQATMHQALRRVQELTCMIEEHVQDEELRTMLAKIKGS